MKIGIISESHDHSTHLRKAIDILKKREVDFAVHCGDYVSPGNVLLFEGLQLIGILGNNDGDVFGLAEAFREIGGDLKGEFGEFFVDGLKFALYHGHHAGILDALVKCNKYDIVIHGHTHKPHSREVGKTLVIDPGTVHGFADRASFIIFDTKTKEIEIIDV